MGVGVGECASTLVSFFFSELICIFMFVQAIFLAGIILLSFILLAFFVSISASPLRLIFGCEFSAAAYNQTQFPFFIILKFRSLEAAIH